MNTIPLVEATDAVLALRVQENLFDLFRAMSMHLAGAELVEKDGLSYHHAFPTNPMFKGVWRTRLNPDEADEAIAETVAWFEERQAPYIFWWFDPHTQPRDLYERLQAYGFDANIEGDPGMAVNLHELNEDISAPYNLTIVPAETQAHLEDWRDVFCASYGVPLFAGQAWVDATLHAGITNAPWKLYVGYLQGKPVATNILFIGGGVAGVYGVGTLPETRGKGIGAVMTLQPLIDARNQGYRFGVLFSTEMGYPVYRRLGFRDVNTRIGRYMRWNG